MSRTNLYACFRIAGYHNDTKLFTQLLCENRINKQTANEHFFLGQQQKNNGIKCSCADCNK